MKGKKLELSTYLSQKLLLSLAILFFLTPSLIAQTVVIPANTTTFWTTQASVPHNGNIATLIVESGATLWVGSNVTIRFGTNGKAIIEPRGRLNLYGTFTALNSYWAGIRVKGVSTSPQLNAYQGVVYINRGTIEHAICGVYSGEDPSSTIGYGGIIKAYRAHFINNLQDIEIPPFQNYSSNSPFPFGNEIDNVSYFSRCHFEIDDNYGFAFDNVDSGLEPSITLKDVRGINIKGCLFEDNRSDIVNLVRDSRKIGIKGYYASFRVDEYCSSPETPTCNGIRTQFKGLGYGIHANQGYWNASITVKNSDFDCIRGIYFLGVDNAQVHLNEFNAYYYNSTGGPISYGLYLDHCDGYSVENNLVGFTWQAGIIVRNNHGNSTRIYRNNFQGSYGGPNIHAYNQNNDFNQVLEMSNGLELFCNETDVNPYPFYITFIPGPNGNNTVGIKPYHYLPGNLFEFTPVEGTGIYYGWPFGLQLFYLHHASAFEPRLQPITATPETVVIINTDVPFTENDCPNNLQNDVGLDEWRIVQLEKRKLHDESLDNLRQLVDGGNTSLLANRVRTATTATAVEVYQVIMQQAPFTSNLVLEEVSKNEFAFSNAMVRDILTAHPQAAKLPEVQRNLDNRLIQLPHFMRQQIDAGMTTISAREQLGLQIATYKSDHDNAVNKAIQLLTSDTEDQTDRMIEFLSGTKDVGFQYRLAGIYDGRGESELADDVISEIETWDLSPKEEKDHKAFVSYRALIREWKQAEKDLANLYSEDIEKLHEYAIQDNLTAAKAINLLALNGINEYPEPLLLPDTNQPQQRVNMHQDALETKENNLTIFPNPSTNYININYTLQEPTDGLYLVITDLNGKITHQQPLLERQNEVTIFTRKFAVGQYNCTIRTKTNIVENKKFVIVK